MELTVQYIASESPITALKKKILGLLKVCPHDRACPAGTGAHECKQTVVPCPRIEAKQSLYFIVDTGEIITYFFYSVNVEYLSIIQLNINTR